VETSDLTGREVSDQWGRIKSALTDGNSRMPLDTRSESSETLRERCFSRVWG